MNLTAKEREVMFVLWERNAPMTAAEICEASQDKTWRETSIYSMMNSLVAKGAVIMCQLRPTNTKRVRVYKFNHTFEEYMAENVAGTYKSSRLEKPFDIEKFVKVVKKIMKEER